MAVASATALVVLDASVVIAFRDPADAHHARAVAALTSHRHDDLVLPVSAYSETLVVPARAGPAALATFERLFDESPIRVAAIMREIGRAAAQLRARHPSLRLPDALVIATGEVLGADVVLTADASWPRISRRAQLI